MLSVFMSFRTLSIIKCFVIFYVYNEETMTFDEIRFALSVNGVEDEDIETLLSYSKSKGNDYKVLDDMLVDMGYEKVFTDEFFGWIDDNIDDYDDEYFTSERNPYRREWDD